jgi:hypothetical protein
MAPRRAWFPYEGWQKCAHADAHSIDGMRFAFEWLTEHPYFSGAAMSTFAPEFSQFWMGSGAAVSSDGGSELRDDESRIQEAALQELAERVSAARSVV